MTGWPFALLCCWASFSGGHHSGKISPFSGLWKKESKRHQKVLFLVCHNCYTLCYYPKDSHGRKSFKIDFLSSLWATGKNELRTNGSNFLHAQITNLLLCTAKSCVKRYFLVNLILLQPKKREGP